MLGHEAVTEMLRVWTFFDASAIAGTLGYVFFLHPAMRFVELARIRDTTSMRGMGMRHCRRLVCRFVPMAAMMRNDFRRAALTAFAVRDLDARSWPMLGDDLLDFVVSACLVRAAGMPAFGFWFLRLLVSLDRLHIAVQFSVA